MLASNAKCNVVSNICNQGAAFVEKAAIIHNHKYDYSQVRYVNINTLVDIVCPVHGPFEQTPKRHYRNGCPKCARKARTLTINQFIMEATAVHGDVYDYSLIDSYRSAKQKLPIRCLLHGIFHQNKNKHVDSATGCPECAAIARPANKRLDVDDLICRMNKVHGGKYSYNIESYTCVDNFIEIICPIHGPFSQRANTHLYSGGGCPACNGISDVLYRWMDDAGNWKIGVTSSHLGLDRIRRCARSRGTGFHHVCTVQTNEATVHESVLLGMFDSMPYSSGDGYTEFRTLSDTDLRQLVNYMENIC
ncbi:hypothetical protein AHP1_1201 [Aeromonas phage Ahp1_CNU-2021]|nr:hypothetical protein AHP1_1201 [Aeromonas phage Ahp1_CNU-2021]